MIFCQNITSWTACVAKAENLNWPMVSKDVWKQRPALSNQPLAINNSYETSPNCNKMGSSPSHSEKLNVWGIKTAV